MTQTRLASLIETCLSTLIGFGLSYALGLLVFPLYGIPISAGTNFQITLWFTVLSIARGYVIRRWFNSQLTRAAQRLAGDSQ